MTDWATECAACNAMARTVGRGGHRTRCCSQVRFALLVLFNANEAYQYCYEPNAGASRRRRAVPRACAEPSDEAHARRRIPTIRAERRVRRRATVLGRTVVAVMMTATDSARARYAVALIIGAL